MVEQAFVPIKYRWLKLVRDKVPEWLIANGAQVKTRVIADEVKFDEKVRAKLVEEAKEVRRARTRENLVEELADLDEVRAKILELHSINEEEISAARAKKALEKGVFNSRIELISTE